MKIKCATSWSETIRLTRPYAIASETFDSVDNIFVRLETRDGIFGLGVASPAPDVTGESADSCRNALSRHLEPLLAGRDIRHLGALLRTLDTAMAKFPAAMAAVDMALHDLLAKFLDVPLVDFLGRYHKSLPTSITIGIKSIEESLAEASEYMNRGFAIFKVKIGSDLEEDIERLSRIREVAGREVKIRVDANQGYTPKAFTEFLQRSAPLDIEFIEQPLKRDDLEAMHRFPEAVRRQTAADESLHRVTDAVKLANRPHPFGIFNIKLMKCGGIATGTRIADIAGIAGLRVMWGCMDESIVGIAAALHAALACPATAYLDLDGSLDLERDPVEGGFDLQNGYLSVLDRPGLGVDLR